MPKGNRVSDEELLRDLRELADDLGYVPTAREVQKNGTYGRATYEQRFPTFSVAVAKAGLIPKPWNLLTRKEISEWHKASVSQDPDYALTGIFFQFLPVKLDVYLDFEPEWLTALAEDTILSIPPEHTYQNERLEIKVPETWTDPHTNEKKETSLPDLLDWCIAEHSSTPLNYTDSIEYAWNKISSEINFETPRPHIVRGGVRKVTKTDLYHTHGVHLARNGASTEWIAQRMGLNKPEQAEAYYAILDHHDEY